MVRTGRNINDGDRKQVHKTKFGMEEEVADEEGDEE